MTMIKLGLLFFKESDENKTSSKTLTSSNSGIAFPKSSIEEYFKAIDVDYLIQINIVYFDKSERFQQMKNYVTLILIIFLTSCQPDENGNNQWIEQESAEWMFELTVNGVTHKAEGEINPNNYYNYFTNNHSIVTSTNVQGWSVSMGIADQSADSYVSGDNGLFGFMMTNPSQGECEANLYVNWSLNNYIYNIYDQWWSYGFTTSPQTLTASEMSQQNIYSNTIPVNVIDLGSASTINYMSGGSLNWGAPLLANYSGTIYFCDGYESVNGQTVYNFDIPIELSFNIKAPRYPN